MTKHREWAFFYTDQVEQQTLQPLADEAVARGHSIRFSGNLAEVADVGVFCSHRPDPSQCRFSVIMLHDLGQRHDIWPDFWRYEPWDRFDIGILPGKDWADRWHSVSARPEAQPRIGVCVLGWPKADLIYRDRVRFDAEVAGLRKTLGLKHECSVLYAPSWENNGKQDDFVRALMDLPVNLILKQAPWSDAYPQVQENICRMNEMHRGCADNVHVIEPDVNIMYCLGLSDLVVSDESSVLLEALLLNVPGVAVIDWLIPEQPPRFSSAPYECVTKSSRAELRATVQTMLEDLQQYRTRLQGYRSQYFVNLGHSAAKILDVIEAALEDRPLPVAGLCDHRSAYFLCAKERSPAAKRLPCFPWSERDAVIGRREVVLCDEPNKHAPPAQVEWHGDTAVVHGYQDFVLTKSGPVPLPGNVLNMRKTELLRPYFVPRFLKHRTVLDLGASAGFFSFWALQQGAERVIAVDMDPAYVRMLEEARVKLGFENLEVVNGKVENWNEPAGMVLALALVHWVYSCTATLGNLDAVVEWLARCTEYVLIVEWVEPADPAIEFFHHTDWNADCVTGLYSREGFEAALSKHFARWQVVGSVSPTRDIYVAFRSRNEIDLSGPLPLLRLKEDIISCRKLTTWGGVDYWSCVYDNGDVIQKQATLDLAEREAFFLHQLGAPYFPRVVDAKNEGDYSVVTLEKVPGGPLQEQMATQLDTLAKFCAFAFHCLNLLRELGERAIVHRDIRPENMLLDGGRPVLIDFGWAVSPEHPYCTPPWLGGSERPPDGSFCDVYSMGKTLEQANAGRFSEFAGVISLMTQADPVLRIADIGVLKTLLAAVAKSLGLSER